VELCGICITSPFTELCLTCRLPGPNAFPTITQWKGNEQVSSQYLGVGAGFAPAQAGNRKGLPLLFEKIHEQPGSSGDAVGASARVVESIFSTTLTIY
jgi:hypothetical protein